MLWARPDWKSRIDCIVRDTAHHKETLTIILIFCIGTCVLETVSNADLLSSKSNFTLGRTIKTTDARQLSVDTYKISVCAFGAWDPTKL